MVQQGKSPSEAKTCELKIEIAHGWFKGFESQTDKILFPHENIT